MPTITLEEAQAHLAELVARLPPGGEVVLTRDNLPVATLKATVPTRKAPRLGTLAGTVTHVAPDFDAIPEGFEDYLP